jgi:two-component system OmpR family sensor kinase/two-component system sensor histidine kinase BaeS
MATELERAEQQRRNLTADVAHELRTPLHIIQGNLEGLLDGVYQPTTEHIQATLDETRLLARLVTDLQTLSLAEAGQLPLHKITLSAADLLEDVVTSFAGQAAAGEVELRLELPAGRDGLEVNGDPDRLDQVFSNLVANALRHTPSGGRVTLRAEPIAAGWLDETARLDEAARPETSSSSQVSASPVVRVQVIDTGSGIAPEDLPYIFDRFWRGDRARTRQVGTGSGLGLAIVRQLVHNHGGQLRVESELNHGTTFTVEI